MNDDELITTVRESVTGVHMTIPEDRSSAAAPRYAPGAGFLPRPERWPWLPRQP